MFKKHFASSVPDMQYILAVMIKN